MCKLRHDLLHTLLLGEMSVKIPNGRGLCLEARYLGVKGQSYYSGKTTCRFRETTGTSTTLGVPDFKTPSIWTAKGQHMFGKLHEPRLADLQDDTKTEFRLPEESSCEPTCSLPEVPDLKTILVVSTSGRG